MTLPDGFFDAGMLLQVLQANKGKEQKLHQVAERRRRAVGRKLALSEY